MTLNKEDLGIDLSDYQSEIGFWRIQLPRLIDKHGRFLFPCDGFGFIVEKKNTIIFDGLGRRIGTPKDLISFIKSRGFVPLGDEDNESDDYDVMCQISFEEFKECKRINLELELKSKQQ